MKIRHYVLVLALGATLGACKDETNSTVAAPLEPTSAPAAVAVPAPTPVAEPAPAPKPIVRHETHREPRVVVQAPAPRVICDNCGVVTAMTAIKQEGEGSGAGAVLGAIAGGVAGNQFGGGHGKEAATAIGAIAGGFGGNMAEKKIREKTAYKITVKMDSGYTRTVTVGAETAANYTVGSKVRVDGENGISPR